MSPTNGALLDEVHWKNVGSLHFKWLPNNPKIDIGSTIQDENDA